MEKSLRRSRWRLLTENRDLSLFLSASLVSQTGDWILDTGMAFQVYLLTHSTLASAAVMLATQIPQVVLGSVAGVIVDRHDRRRMMIGTNVISALVIWPVALVQDSGSVWIILVVAAVTNCVSPFFSSAEASLLPGLARRPENFVTVNALHAQVRNVARLIGAALGGILITVGGLTALAVADTASFLVAAVLVVAIRHRLASTPTRRTGLLAEWRAGLAIVRHNRVLLVLAAFFLLRGVGEGAMGTLFAPFVNDVLGAGGSVYGAILAAQAIGGIVGGLVITLAGRRASPRRLFAWGTLAFGILDLALFLYPLIDASSWPAVLLIAVVGVPGAALNAGMLTLFQSTTGDLTRGRVFGLLVSAENATMLLSTLLAGTLAGSVGIIPVISTQGVVYVLTSVIALTVLSRRRRSGGVLVSEPV
ncbi:MFS transporter [Frondihabitans sucicola]|uniref:MFS transporter n=1 Tax=Frondihabitans sucicola TaxID=1268041 RepID=A0ABM8GJE4_9MICO|nr:MFS transporter [Frondihabitans sucicola]